MLNRRQFVATAGAAALAAQKARRPNVLFLMSDEHSPHVVGAYGNRIIHTPAIDALARDGVAFASAYCQNPICVPSRASFVTGRMASNVRVYDNSGGLDATAATLADVFKNAGYAAGWFGKEHWGGDPRFDNPWRQYARQEFKKRRGSGERRDRSRLPQDAGVAPWPVTAEDDTITKELAVRFLKENRGRPFFAGVSFIKPHFPFVVQEQYWKPYKDAIDLPRATKQMIDQLPAVSKAEREKYGFASLTDEQIRKARAIYFGMVSYIDDQIRDVLRTLDELKLRHNTIVLYIADHGELAGEHGLWYKNSFYEASARVPFIWSYPRALPKDRRVTAPVMNIDIFPTLCDLCNLAKPAALEGRSLLPLISGKEDGRDRYALSENFRGGSAGRMIRAGDWKYCHYSDSAEQLFNLSEDPHEEVNLAAAPAQRDRVADLRERALRNWKPRARKTKV